MLVLQVVKPIDNCLSVSPLVQFGAVPYFVVDSFQNWLADKAKVTFCWVNQSTRYGVWKVVLMVFHCYKCLLFAHGFDSVTATEFLRYGGEFKVNVFNGCLTDAKCRHENKFYAFNVKPP